MGGESGPGLTPTHRKFFEDNGYLVLDQFIAGEECQSMMTRIGQLVDGFDPTSISIFSTKNQKSTTDDYFYKSANNISFFFEEKGFDEDGKLRQAKALSINKVGHALHDLDPVFRAFSRSEKVAAIMASLGYQTPIPVQSMYIFKQPGIGGEVVPHQDNTFLYTDPPSATGLWVALQDATQENGCLWALPGSHKGGMLRRFFKEEGGVSYDKQVGEFDMKDFVPLEVKAGALVLLHGNLVHSSYENKSSKSRHAYSVHVVEGNGCTWSPSNWLQRSDDFPFEPLFVKAEQAAEVAPAYT